MLRRNSFRLFYRIENRESWLMESKKTSSDGPTSWRETTVGAIRGCVSQEENDFQAHLCSRYGINPGYIQSYVLKPYPTACASTIRRVVYDGWTRETHVRTYVCVSRASTVKLRSCLTTFRLLLWPSWKFPSAQGTQPQNRPSQKKEHKNTPLAITRRTSSREIGRNDDVHFGILLLLFGNRITTADRHNDSGTLLEFIGLSLITKRIGRLSGPSLLAPMCEFGIFEVYSRSHWLSDVFPL